MSNYTDEQLQDIIEAAKTLSAEIDAVNLPSRLAHITLKKALNPEPPTDWSKAKFGDVVKHKDAELDELKSSSEPTCSTVYALTEVGYEGDHIHGIYRDKKLCMKAMLKLRFEWAMNALKGQNMVKIPRDVYLLFGSDSTKLEAVPHKIKDC